MFCSKLYKNHYPLKSDSDVLLLTPRERELLVKHIKDYPFRATEAIQRAWRCGLEVAGHPRKGGLLGLLVPSFGASATLVELCQLCNGLAAKIEACEPVTDSDIMTTNLILYSNKYGKWLSRYLFPTP